MAKIRKDFDGSVTVAGVVLRAGDRIPEGVRVGGHLTEDGKPVGDVPVTDAEPVDACATACRRVEPLTVEELAEAESLGIPTDLHPERVRGAIFGFEVGVRSVDQLRVVNDEEHDREQEEDLENGQVTLLEEPAKRRPGRPKKTP